MDAGSIIDGIGLILLPIIGWLFYSYSSQIKELHLRCDDAENELGDLRLHVAEQYLNKNEFKESMTRIEDAIKLVFQKIDRLVENK